MNQLVDRRWKVLNSWQEIFCGPSKNRKRQLGAQAGRRPMGFNEAYQLLKLSWVLPTCWTRNENMWVFGYTSYCISGRPTQYYKGAKAEKPTGGNKSDGKDVAGFGNERDCIYYHAWIEKFGKANIYCSKIYWYFFTFIRDCIINPYICTSCN